MYAIRSYYVNNGKYICARVRARYAASLENQTPTQNQQFFNIVLYDDFSANESECGTINEETGLAEGIIGNAIIKKESKSQIVNPINSPLDENDVIVITSYSIHYTKLYEKRILQMLIVMNINCCIMSCV